MRQIGLITVSVTTTGGELTSKGLYTYTRQGKPLSKDVVLDDKQCNYSHTMEYDQSGFMKKETVSSPYIGFHNQRTAVEYNYNPLGQIASKYFDIRTTVEYEYNLRGQLTSIQSPFFSQNIKYETGTKPCYNGNISEYTVSYNGGEAVKRTFSYDRMNRLTAMTSSDGFNTAYTYNINSAPLTIQRYGLTSDGTVGLIDDLTMTYSGNQLTRVTDSADPVILENSSDFNAADGRYTYDADGRLIADTERGITNIEYSPIGKPLKITSDNGTLTFSHYADGTKREKIHIYSTRGQTRKNAWLYEDAFELRSGNNAPYFLDLLHLPWGYIYGTDVHVYIQDYQGNNRAVVDQMRCAVQTTDYYPYGMPMATSTGAACNAYKYSGKEFETRMGLNQYDYHARLQIPSIAMFNQTDPKAGDYPWLNTYLYCAANPIANIDPTGKRVWPVDTPYNGAYPEHSDDFGKYRGYDHPHGGVDINIGSGSFDLGAPVYATHDGKVESVSSYKDGNGGGNRVKIKSKDGYISTFYMHLNSIEDGIKVGTEISEGQQIGTIGGSAYGSMTGRKPHLHYEMFINGKHIDPASTKNRASLKDPQVMLEINQGSANQTSPLPEVVVTAPGPSKRNLLVIPPPVVEEPQIIQR